MKAEEARKIWEEEVSSKAQGLLEYIKKMILQYTYHENAFLYFFEFPNFATTVQDTGEPVVPEEFTHAVLEKIITYFESLGFKVKADKENFRLWISYLKNKDLEKDSFSEKLTNIIKVRRNYRSFSGINDHLGAIYSQIKEKAHRHRSLQYPLALNVANTKSLVLEDLLQIIDELEKKGYEVIIEGLLFNRGTMENREWILQAMESDLCFEKLEICLIIKW
ncbi:MAG: hypothetical protein GXW85_02790 [Clostridia bacterium]|nr:hypothetical protein [Clostridia bacterium]